MIEIDIARNNSDNVINSKNLKTYCKEVLNYKGYKSYSVSLIFVNEEELKEMKNTYFQQNLYTDVIAFNFSEDKENFEGEIYISIMDVKENAKLFAQSFEDEFKRVIIHGALHLIGYNDIEDKDKLIMQTMENKYLQELNFKIIN